MLENKECRNQLRNNVGLTTSLSEQMYVCTKLRKTPLETTNQEIHVSLPNLITFKRKVNWEKTPLVNQELRNF